MIRFRRVLTSILFLSTVLLLIAMPLPAADGDALSAREMVERIKKNLGVPWNENQNVDTFKAGNPDSKVTGIATTFLATLDVLKQAKAKGLNLIITHEPPFYSGDYYGFADEIKNDKLLAAKHAYIRKHGLVVWRFHNHIHKRQPDGIIFGMIEQIGWHQYQRPGQERFFEMPETTVGEIAAQLKKTFQTSSIRVVGKPDPAVTKVAFTPGFPGSLAHIRLLQRDDVELLVGGETKEWESVVYAQDAVSMGMKKAFILLGHSNSEEAGMKHVAEWLRGFIKEVAVAYVPGGDPFWEPKDE